MLFLIEGKTVTCNRDHRNWVAAAPFTLKNASVWSRSHFWKHFILTQNGRNKTVNTYRNFLQFREVSSMQIIDWIQACWDRRNDRNVTSKENKMADLPDPCAQALSSMVGHLFQNYDTMYVRFFPRILAIIPTTRYTCVFLSRMLAFFPALWGFYSRVYDHFLRNAHILQTSMWYMGSQKVVV